MTDINVNLTFKSRDDFNRKPIAEKIITLLKSNTKISPMVINGNWGSGKTEFTNKLINLFNENLDKHKLIYIDAFQADNADEPLMTLMASLLNVLPDSEGKTELRKKAIPAIRFGVKTVLKAGVSWVLRQDAADIADDFDGDIKNACDETINASIDNLLKDHQQADKNIETLRIALSEITKDSPIVFFIDELDRCRPDFAIKMLEKIKHIFEMPNVQFVLIANKNQLRSSINHIYGSSISAQKYLDKFLNYSFSLPHSHSYVGHQFKYYSAQYYLDLVESSEVLRRSKFSEFRHDEFIQKLFQVNQISLREVETYILNIEIYQTLTGKFNKINLGGFLLTLLGIFIFCFKPRLQKEIELSIFDAKSLNTLFDAEDILHKQFEYFFDNVGIVVSLIYIEANQNSLNNYEEFGVSEEEMKQLKATVNNCFSSTIYYGEAGRIKILLDTINSLKFM